ncbi:TPA: replication endonuclease [Photobacterium damselae]
MINNRIQPNQDFIEACQVRKSLWRVDCVWAQDKVSMLPSDLGAALYKQYVSKWESYVRKNGKSRSANIWLRNQVDMMTTAINQFPVHIEHLRNEVKRTQLARDLSNQCYAIMSSGSDAGASIKTVRDEMLSLARQWNFSVSVPAQYLDLDADPAETFALSQMARLITEEWWVRKLDIAYRRFCEHCRIIAGKVRKGVSAYLSRVALRDYRDRKAANLRALSQMVAKNELTGEEIVLLEAVKASVSNPEIRRHELMVRMRGFEDIAEEEGLMGGFFTVTTPSRYHAFIKDKNGKTRSNKKYQGSTPRQASNYLGKVWARARAKLNRLDIPLIGFRVCEPHHDATPHWHMLFFFKPEHEQAIRYVLADYFTREDRDELRVTNTDFNQWALAISPSEEFNQLKSYLKKACAYTDEECTEEFLQLKKEEFIKSIPVTAKRVSPRFDYKAIDPEKGSATGYIAKYISKNIDGFKVDEDFETDMAANATAESVTGWSSEWGIRQFQQIGGPPVSVWRELRRMEQDEITKAGIAAAKAAGQKYQRPVKSYLELKATKPTVEVARIAADSGSWSMFISAMGGLFCPRKEQALRIVYKPHESKYGEVVTKLKGITDRKTVTMLTRADGWVIGKKSSEGSSALALSSDDSRATWSSVNNCTEGSKNEVKDLVLDHLKRIGKEADEDLLKIMGHGARVNIGDGQRIWVEQTDIGMQLRVQDFTSESFGSIGWDYWDIEDAAAKAKPPIKTYKEKVSEALKGVTLNTHAMADSIEAYWNDRKL